MSPSLPAEPPATWIEQSIIGDATLSLIRELINRSAARVNADNAALWLADVDHLVPVLGSGPHSNFFIGKFAQPLLEGFISLVHASGQPVCENAISQSAQHSPRLDKKLGITTDAMIALPLYATGEIIGVVTCVHTRVDGEQRHARSFSQEDLAEFEFLNACLSRLIEADLSSI